jgi:hypothetical protein
VVRTPTPQALPSHRTSKLPSLPSLRMASTYVVVLRLYSVQLLAGAGRVFCSYNIHVFRLCSAGDVRILRVVRLRGGIYAPEVGNLFFLLHFVCFVAVNGARMCETVVNGAVLVCVSCFCFVRPFSSPQTSSGVYISLDAGSYQWWKLLCGSRSGGTCPHDEVFACIALPPPTAVRAPFFRRLPRAWGTSKSLG